MPRKFLKKKRTLRPSRKAWYDKKYSVGTIARSAYRTGKYLASLINVEKKFHDVTANNLVPTTTPTIINLSNIGQGADYNNRDGNSVLLQTLQYRMNVLYNGTPGFNKLRMIIFRDNDQRGTDPAAADLLESTAAATAINSPLLHYVNQRFSVLQDTVYTVAAGHLPVIAKKKFMKMPPGTHLKYSSTAAADASNWEGALYCLFVSDQAANGPSVDYYFRLRFTDN